MKPAPPVTSARITDHPTFTSPTPSGRVPDFLPVGTLRQDRGRLGRSAPARVLVVSHEAQRTGAPKVAIEIQRSLHGEGAKEVVSLLRAGGPLTGEFAATSDRLRREPLARARAVLRRRRRFRRAVDHLDELIAWLMLKRSRPAIVYLNTVKSACYVRPALDLGIPTILHVHELGMLASSTLQRYQVGERWKSVRLVACSTATRDGLAELLHVPMGDIDVVHSPIDVTDVERRGQAGGSLDGDGTSPLVVAACGLVNDRKGADLWVRVAKAVRDERPGLAVSFQWVGRRPSGWPCDLAKELGVDDRIDWVGEVAEPHPLIAAADVFTLPSREDPFPLVVLEAMALARPIVAFDVGGVREQLDDTGVVVPAEDVAAMAGAVVELLDDEAERQRLGAEAAHRVRLLYDIGPFCEHIRRIVKDVADMGEDRRVAVLKSPNYEKFRRQREDSGLPYRIDYLREYGYAPSFSDIRYRPPWNASWLRPAIDKLEAVGVPTLQTLAMAPRIVRSDAVLAMFESEGHLLAMARALRLPTSRRTPMVVISCWLAFLLPTVGPTRLAWYRRMYRTVDGIVVFSTNQIEPLAQILNVDEDAVHYVPFGVDSEWFAPRSVGTDDGFVLAVGRDRGRDWPTLLTAAQATGLPTKIACRQSDIAGLAVPENVEVLGYVDLESYRSLLHRARVSVVATSDVAYPSGQTVALESMATAKATVVTRTPSLIDYLDEGVNALTVPVGDANALANAIASAFEDAALRDRLGSGARDAVERIFNARVMWGGVAAVLDEVSGR